MNIMILSLIHIFVHIISLLYVDKSGGTITAGANLDQRICSKAADYSLHKAVYIYLELDIKKVNVLRTGFFASSFGDLQLKNCWSPKISEPLISWTIIYYPFNTSVFFIIHYSNYSNFIIQIQI